MPGLVDCHFNPPLYFRAGTTVTTFFDLLVNTLAPGELMFRNVTYAREVSTEVVVCMFGVYNKHSWLFTSFHKAREQCLKHYVKGVHDTAHLHY